MSSVPAEGQSDQGPREIRRPEVDSLSRFAYANGTTVIDWAENCVKTLLDARDEVQASRVVDPATFPLHGPDTSTGMVARRILAWLMNAGWTPPGNEDVV